MINVVKLIRQKLLNLRKYKGKNEIYPLREHPAKKTYDF